MISSRARHSYVVNIFQLPLLMQGSNRKQCVDLCCAGVCVKRMNCLFVMGAHRSSDFLNFTRITCLTRIAQFHCALVEWWLCLCCRHPLNTCINWQVTRTCKKEFSSWKAVVASQRACVVCCWSRHLININFMFPNLIEHPSYHLEASEKTRASFLSHKGCLDKGRSR